jgi:hypothetical protein
MFGQQSNPSVEEQQRGHQAGQETQQYPRKMEEQYEQQQSSSSSKQQRGTRSQIRRQKQQASLPKPGQPQIGVIIAGFPSPFAKELAEECSQEGIFVSDIGLGYKGSENQQFDLSDGTKIEVLDCDSTETHMNVDRARDALEKEGAEAVMVLDVSQDCRSVDLYNRLKLPFIHAGSDNLSDEFKCKESTLAAKNTALISPFVPREGAMVQLMFETFARTHQGLFRDWKLDCSDHLGENNAVAAAKRRTMDALSFLVDRDVSQFSSLSSGKGTLSGSDDKSQEQQQQPQQQQQHQQEGGGGGMLAKLGLTSAATTTKETVKSATSRAAGSTMGAKSSFTLRSPDGKHSFSMGHEDTGLADTCSVIYMAQFLADKLVKQREPRVWGIKDWVYGVDDLNRQIAEECECDANQQGQRQQRTQIQGRRRHPQPSTIQSQQERGGPQQERSVLPVQGETRAGEHQIYETGSSGQAGQEHHQKTMGERVAEGLGLGGGQQHQQQQGGYQQQQQPTSTGQNQ